jgi:hypothetical protein
MTHPNFNSEVIDQRLCADGEFSHLASQLEGRECSSHLDAFNNPEEELYRRMTRAAVVVPVICRQAIEIGPVLLDRHTCCLSCKEARLLSNRAADSRGGTEASRLSGGDVAYISLLLRAVESHIFSLASRVVKSVVGSYIRLERDCLSYTPHKVISPPKCWCRTSPRPPKTMWSFNA